MIILIVFGLLSGLAQADLHLNRLNNTIPTYWLRPEGILPVTRALVFEDSTGSLSFKTLYQKDQANQIEWKELSKLNLGYKKSRIWFKFRAENPLSNSSWLLEQPHPLTRFVDTYFVKSGIISHQVAGRARPFSERLVRHFKLLFPFELRKGEQANIYMSYESIGPILPAPGFMSRDYLVEDTIQLTLKYGMYYGVLWAMVIYNLFLFVGTRDKIYLFYVLYVAFFSVFNMCLAGYAYQFFWPNWIEWNDRSTFVSVSLSHLFVSLFTLYFLDLKKYSKTSYGILLAVIGWSLAAFLGVCLAYGHTSVQFVGKGMFYANLALLIATLFAKKAGAKNSKYFIAAFSGVLTGNAIYAARAAGIVPDNAFTNHSIQVASLAEVFLLAFALADRIKRLQQEKEKQRSIAKLAAEISHNIRSPLATLKAALPLIRDCDESVRTLIRYATHAITDQANQLLDFRRESVLSGKIREKTWRSNTLRDEFIPGIVEQVVSSKRLEFKRYDLIHLEIPDDQLFVFAKINAVHFTVILSNLINNAADSLKENGKISVSVECKTENQIEVAVKDNGCGIHPDTLEKILNRTYVSEKPKGNGIGILHAMERVETWGGRLTLSSEINKGTVSIIHLPRAPTPEWIISEVVIGQSDKIAVLDDDVSIHKIWEQRLLKSDLLFEGSIEHLSNGNALHLALEQETQPELFLVDHELLGQEKTGLQLINELKINDRSILVTSKWDEQEVVDRCLELGVKMLPKLLAGKIPIELKDCSHYNDPCYVLIDDDPIIRKTWELSAKPAKKKVVTFATFAQFKEVWENYNLNTIVCVDYYFDEAAQGYAITQALSLRGFTELFLVTGENTEQLPEMPWLKGILSKDPLWLSSGRSPIANRRI